MKRFISFFCAFLILFSVSACSLKNENIPTTPPQDLNQPSDENEVTYSRYENQLYGIIIEYPEGYERVGNLDTDGHISFAGDNTEIFIYLPDKNADLRLTDEEYALDVIGLREDEDAGTVTYGKSVGYRTFSRAGGLVTVQFIVKGLDGFYRFDYVCPEARFDENEPPFSYVMGSIRINDGKYLLLNSMLAEYMILLDYASSMQYVTDANYANHCLNTYLSSKQDSYLTTATDCFTTIKEKMEEILAHTPDKDEFFIDLWTKISERAEKTLTACNDALSAIEAGNIETAQHTSRVSFGYELSDLCESYIDAIKTEIGEY